MKKLLLATASRPVHDRRCASAVESAIQGGRGRFVRRALGTGIPARWSHARDGDEGESLHSPAAGKGRATKVAGVPDVDYGGQGGLGDVVLHPKFAENRLVYLSYAEGGPGGTRGAAVMLSRLERDRGWSRVVGCPGHLAPSTPRCMATATMATGFSSTATAISGSRPAIGRNFTPAQDMQTNLGKILRLHDDGSTPKDNPFVDHPSRDALVDDVGVYGQVWSSVTVIRSASPSISKAACGQSKRGPRAGTS